MKNDKIRLECHIHTKYSKDSRLNKYFILMMCKLKKINALAITDHNTIDGAIQFLPFLKRHNIQTIIGEEIMTNQGEIIGLFLKENIAPYQSIEETIKKIKEQNGIVYLPHPYDEKRIKTVLKPKYQEIYINDIDLIEIHNGRNVEKKYDEKQLEISKKLGIRKIIGSDAHTFFELGRNYVELSSIKKENFLKEIEKANFYQKKCLKIAHQVTKVVRLIKMIEMGDLVGIQRIITNKCKRNKQGII